MVRIPWMRLRESEDTVIDCRFTLAEVRRMGWIPPGEAAELEIRAEQAEDALHQPPEQVARLFHEAYERLATSFGYETRKQSAVPWEDVPEPNKSLMVAVAGEVLAALAAAGADTGQET